MKNPRIYVTLDPDVYAGIARYARSLNVSKSSVVADIVTLAHEHLDRVNQLHDRLAQLDRLPPDIKGDLRRRLTIDAGNIAEFETLIVEKLDQLLDDVEVLDFQRAEEHGESRAPTRGDVIWPPSINKGAKTPPNADRVPSEKDDQDG